MRLILAIWTAKILIIVGKIFGKKGSSTPGAIALKICPNMLRILGKKIETTVVVCGTNGKTTTNNLICSALSKKGAVVCNKVGANMLNGVACAYAKSSGLLGGMKAKHASIEVDELSARHVFEHITPQLMVITNLSRDQLDRYGEIDIAQNALKEAIEKAPSCELILNSDDQFVSNIAVTNIKHFFDSSDSNINAATVVCSLLGVPADFSDYKPPIGRMEHFTIKGREFVLNLAKNPAGFNYAIRAMLDDKREKSVIIAINDNAQDGIDISWLWDVDFENLSEISGIIACGTRKDDLALRLKHAHCGWLMKSATVREAIDTAVDRAKPVTYVLVNYTALFGTQKLLRRLSK